MLAGAQALGYNTSAYDLLSFELPFFGRCLPSEGWADIGALAWHGAHLGGWQLQPPYSQPASGRCLMLCCMQILSAGGIRSWFNLNRDVDTYLITHEVGSSAAAFCPAACAFSSNSPCCPGPHPEALASAAAARAAQSGVECGLLRAPGCSSGTT